MDFDDDELDKPYVPPDPIERFFDRLPRPRASTSLLEGDAVDKFDDAKDYLSRTLSVRSSTDPDAKYIEDLVKESDGVYGDMRWVYDGLMRLAFSKPISDQDRSMKARYLRFCRWIAQGRRPRTAFFRPWSDGPYVVPENSPSYAYLDVPLSVRRCAECKKAAKYKCSGCHLRTDGNTTFAVAYCSKKCQKHHWKLKHKDECGQAQRLFHATSLFQEILEHFLAVTYPAACSPRSIVEENGMTVVKFEPLPEPTTFRTEMRRIPPGLAPDQDAFRAALHIFGGYAAFVLARELVEMLIRPCCSTLENNAVEPENMHRPVCFSSTYHDYHASLECHEVLVATLPCGTNFVLDPTGIRYGWKEVVAPESLYMSSRMHTLSTWLNMGPDVGSFHTDDEAFLTPPPTFATDMMKTVVDSLQRQIDKKYGSVHALLGLGNAEFAGAREAIAAAAKKGFDFLADEIARSAVPKDSILNSGGVSMRPWANKDLEVIWYRTRRSNVESMPDWLLTKVWRARWKRVIAVEWPQDAAE
ncbi:hypothetical protein VTJ49DRAFT_1296 [Mycothermus thermophilus]|uniref:MYND-type domain-containing protein n=1 Tax=Humicola insolens TaxID=85995 RepID=A0ABR3VDC9_HUMIN